MVRAISLALGFAGVILLAGCGATGRGGAGAVAVPAGTQAVSEGPQVIVKGSTPVQLYSHIARQARGCWLNARNPALPRHEFRAEAGAGGRSGNETRIVIYEREKDGKLGLKAFTIDFVARRDGTQILARNLKLSYPLGQKFVSDVGYWAQGGANCDGPVDPAASHPQIEGPRTSR